MERRYEDRFKTALGAKKYIVRINHNKVLHEKLKPLQL